MKNGSRDKSAEKLTLPPVPLVLPPLLAHTSPDDLSCDTPKKKKERKQLSGQMDVCRDTLTCILDSASATESLNCHCVGLSVCVYINIVVLVDYVIQLFFVPLVLFLRFPSTPFVCCCRPPPPPPFCCCKETNSFLAASSFESRSGYPTEIIKIIKAKILGATRIVCVSALLIYKCITSPQTRRRRIQ